MYGHRALSLLDKELEILFLNLDLNEETCQNVHKIGPKLSKHFKSNIIIYRFDHIFENEPIFQFPKIYDDTLPVINLIFTNNGGDNHIDLIEDISQIQKIYHKYFCLYCNKTRSEKSFRHICFKRYNLLCRACKFHKPSENTYICKFNKDRLCLLDNSFEPTKCDREGCYVTFRSQKCKKKHDAICHTQFYCNSCKKWSTTGNDFNTWEKLRDNHDCKKKKVPFLL